MNISKAAQATGLTAKTIRYYESLKLISPAHRLENGYRDYNESHLRELSFISHARELGFTLKECSDLLGLYNDNGRKSADVKSLALKKIADVEDKISQLQVIRESLQKLTECCHGDDMPDCPIIDRLAKGKDSTSA
ncbi:Cu(I)-responsive transcriptional regulator [Endozoicomonas numazuensis]|uniref:Transcriptional regulator n=1 Tax=Endozoicomonas numazuensis TaxID=1137799 RepID=A0A081NJ94_9GAMM|nr:Cu(I)-responsive transcriptional regulator [Endozoicomonas numazuensis]KEQ18517.1 transcriptional regulator [Endozoicomonas numazuensis]